MKKDTRVRDINPFGLRMQAELKERLDREAKINGRSLNAEIVERLRVSLDPPIRTESGYRAEQANSSYTPEISDIERQLLTIFRRLPVEKQLALLSLFN
jgi:hypothetical protein